MYLFMYIRMYICMYVRMYLCMHVLCAYVFIHVRMYVYHNLFHFSITVSQCVFSPHCSRCDRLVIGKTTFQMNTAQFDRMSGEDQEIATS